MTSVLPNISTLQSALARRREHAQATEALSRAEKEVSTGVRADLFRDIGQRAAESVRLRHQVKRNEGYIASNKLLSGQMEIAALAINEMRKQGDDFLALAVSGASPGTPVSGELQNAARATIEKIMTGANTRYLGDHLFAGTKQDTAPLQPWDTVNPNTGLSPADVLASIVSGPPASVGNADTLIAEIASVFDGTHPDPDKRFEATFYNGTPQAAGTRVEARIDESVVLSHGVQANDDSFRELMRGLAMLASVDVAQISDQATYSRYVNAAVDAISAGTRQLLEQESGLGLMQGVVEDTIAAQEKVNDIYSYRLVDIESVDPYEAASRLNLLQSQLEASYAVTARLSRLSILNFIA